MRIANGAPRDGDAIAADSNRLQRYRHDLMKFIRKQSEPEEIKKSDRPPPSFHVFEPDHVS